MKKLAIILTLLCAAAFAQKGTFTDSRDGKKYNTIKIGKQTWMAQNLNYKPEASSWCYENNEDNCEKYGRLYTNEIAGKVCPAGWHLPSYEEWEKLNQTVGTKKKEKVQYGPGAWNWEFVYVGAGKKLKTKSGWNKRDDGKNGNGTDNNGFAALPAGLSFAQGKFGFIGIIACWYGENGGATIYNDDDNLSLEGCGIYGSPDPEGRSVRCIKD